MLYLFLRQFLMYRFLKPIIDLIIFKSFTLLLFQMDTGMDQNFPYLPDSGIENYAPELPLDSTMQLDFVDQRILSKEVLYQFPINFQ